MQSKNQKQKRTLIVTKFQFKSEKKIHRLLCDQSNKIRNTAAAAAIHCTVRITQHPHNMVDVGGNILKYIKNAW